MRISSPCVRNTFKLYACGKLRSIYLRSPYGQVDTGFKCIYNLQSHEKPGLFFLQDQSIHILQCSWGVLKVPTDFKQKKLYEPLKLPF